jgi:hypothetical protein
MVEGYTCQDRTYKGFQAHRLILWIVPNYRKSNIKYAPKNEGHEYSGGSLFIK